jgi:hypothetical protein
MKIEKDITYLGIVEDNNDPKKLGRCRIRVFGIFDTMETQDIPWAKPWKDLIGENFGVPEIKKIVTVTFDSGNIYTPEYIYADNYNLNLEEKLKSLTGENYTSMKSVLFDHKTQLYVNDADGLVIDYKMNQINMTDSNVDINLKDNFSKVNIGDSSANQSVILGDNFLDLMEEFFNILSGSSPFLSSMGPVFSSPELMILIKKFKSLKNTKYLSRNVFVVDNGSVNSVRVKNDGFFNSRSVVPIKNDDWSSNVYENELKFDDIDFKPQYGTGRETNQGDLTSAYNNVSLDNIKDISGEVRPEINRILSVMKEKEYIINDEPYYMNFIGIRRQRKGNKYSNRFKDDFWVIWKNMDNKWESKMFKISTIPGLYKDKKTNYKMKEYILKEKPGRNGLGILVPDQYVNSFVLVEPDSSSDSGFKRNFYFRNIGKQKAYRDKNYTSDVITFSNEDKLDIGNHEMHLHIGFPGGIDVNNWSEGCQVFSKSKDFNELVELSRRHIKFNGNKFNYTLITDSDI